MTMQDFTRLGKLSLAAKIELLAKLEQRSISDSHEVLNDAAKSAIRSIKHNLESAIKDESITTILNQYL